MNRQVMLEILRDYKRPYDKITELIRQEMLIQVKRGLFIAGPRSLTSAPENLLLANHICGPSYISSDTALSYWGLIPERVYEFISMTTNQGKIFKTPVGRFRYIRLSLPYYSLGLQRVQLATQQMALIACKEKALCDKIVTTQRLVLRSIRQTKEYLTEDLRISREALRELNTSAINDYLNDTPKKESILLLIKTLNDL